MIPISSTYSPLNASPENKEKIDPLLPPLAEPRHAILERLIGLGICNEFGEVSESYRDFPLPPLNPDEITPLFVELFAMRQTNSLFKVNLIEASGIFLKNLYRHEKDYTAYSYLRGEYVNQFLFDVIKTYKNRVFFLLGVPDLDPSLDAINLTPQKINIFTRIDSISSNDVNLNKFEKIAIKCIMSNIKINNSRKFDVKEVIQRGNSNYLCSRILSIKDECLDQKRKSLNWLLGSKDSKPTFTVNSLCLPLKDILWGNPLQCGEMGRELFCQPTTRSGRPLQAFLDGYFKYIRGDGHWLELISLYVNGFISMREPIKTEQFYEEELFEMYYSSIQFNPLFLSQDIEHRIKSYTPTGKLFFLLNTCLFLERYNQTKAIEVLRREQLSSLNVENPVFCTLSKLLYEESLPFEVISALLKVAVILRWIAQPDDKKMQVHIQQEERRREVILLQVSGWVLHLTCNLADALETLSIYFEKKITEGHDSETKCIQAFLSFGCGPTYRKVQEESLSNCGMSAEAFVKKMSQYLCSSSLFLNTVGLYFFPYVETKLTLEIESLGKKYASLSCIQFNKKQKNSFASLTTFLIVYLVSRIEYLLPDFELHEGGVNIIVNKSDQRSGVSKKFEQLFKLVITSCREQNLQDLPPKFWVRFFHLMCCKVDSCQLVTLWSSLKELFKDLHEDRMAITSALLFALRHETQKGYKNKAHQSILSFRKEYLEIPFTLLEESVISTDSMITGLMIMIVETVQAKDPTTLTLLTALMERLSRTVEIAKRNVPEKRGDSQQEEKYYQQCLLVATDQYLGLLFKLLDMKQISEETMRANFLQVGFKQLAFRIEHWGNLISLFCEPRYLKTVADLITPDSEPEFKGSGNHKYEVGLNMIKQLDCKLVVSFLQENICPQLVDGSLRILYQALACKEVTGLPESEIIRYGIFFVDYANKHKVGNHTLLVVVLYSLIGKRDKIKKSIDKLKVSSCFLELAKVINDSLSNQYFADCVLVTLSMLLRVAKSPRNEEIEEKIFSLFSIIPDILVVNMHHFTLNKFEFCCEIYWELCNLAIFFGIPDVKGEISEKQCDFIKKLLDKALFISSKEERQNLLKYAKKFFVFLEIEGIEVTKRNEIKNKFQLVYTKIIENNRNAK